MNTAVDIPHLKVPFKIDANGAAVVDQDSDDEIIQCVDAICRTPRGLRLDSPDFGIDEVVLRENGPDRDKLQRAILYWEPRARVAIDIQSPDNLAGLFQIVEVNVGGAF